MLRNYGDDGHMIRRLGLTLLLTAWLGAPLPLSGQHQQSSCPSGDNCFVSAGAVAPDPYSLAAVRRLADATGMVPLQVRMSDIGGRFAHKWVQFGTGEDAITFGYGAANFPLIDFGQIVVTEPYGSRLISNWHLFPFHITPAEASDNGHVVGQTVYITVPRAQELIQEESRHRFVSPYIPLFHDCHTYVCSLMAKVEGKSSLPCYLWFKGHF